MEQFTVKRFWKMFFSLFVGFVLWFFLNSPGITESKARLCVSSKPSGCKVIVKGAQIATTRAVVELNKDEETVLRFEKEGYKPVEVPITCSVDYCKIGSIFYPGLDNPENLCLQVDLIKGVMSIMPKGWLKED